MNKYAPVASRLYEGPAVQPNARARRAEKRRRARKVAKHTRWMNLTRQAMR